MNSNPDQPSRMDAWHTAASMVSFAIVVFAMLLLAERLQLQSWKLHSSGLFYTLSGVAFLAGVFYAMRLVKKGYLLAIPQFVTAIMLITMAVLSSPTNTFRPAMIAVMLPLVLGFSLGVDVGIWFRSFWIGISHPRSIFFTVAVLGLSVALALFIRPYYGACTALTLSALILILWCPARAGKDWRLMAMPTLMVALAAILSIAWVLGSGPQVAYYHNELQIVNAEQGEGKFKILVFRNPKDKLRLVYYRDMVFYNSTADPRRTEALACPALNQVPRPERALIIGGESTGAARILLTKSKVKQVVVLTEYPKVYRLIDKMRGTPLTLKDNRLSVVDYSGIMGLLNMSRRSKPFDIILVDLPPLGPALDWPHTSDFYIILSQMLSKTGVMATRIGNMLAKNLPACFLGNVQNNFEYMEQYRVATTGLEFWLESHALAAKRPFSGFYKVPKGCAPVLGPEAGKILFIKGRNENLKTIPEPEGGCLYKYYGS